ncbi:UNVERIFIED_CONTAM: hypothetical protein Scaly_1664700 [Sesamum calycinum]|uniref:Uncharacterized protein n=1 Tax=Sesamum calycinum TaxID=2727403 RepID=A0AAW2NRM6_9LAMI
MYHLSNAEAWRHFDRAYLGFAVEPHNVKLVCAQMGSHRTDSLIKELQDLWHVGVLTRDNTENETLTIDAALMWTLDDLPTYKMAFGWSTTDVTGC